VFAAVADQLPAVGTNVIQDRLEQRHTVGLHQDDPRIAVANDVQHFARRVAPVDAAAQQAGLVAGVQVLVDLQVLVAEDGGHIALLQAKALQGSGQPVGAGVNLLPAQCPVAVVIGNPVRVVRRAAGNVIAWQHGRRLLLRIWWGQNAARISRA
jgi:hypothetical protein